MKGCAVEVMINDCPVDFELERDKKVADIIESVSEWTRERDLVFFEMYVDDELYAIDAVPDISLSGVKVINCIVQSRAVIVFSTVDEAARYCERAASFINQILDNGACERKEIDDLVSGISWLLEVMNRVCGLLGLDYKGLKYKDSDLTRHIRNAELLRDGLAVAGGDDVREIIRAHKDIFTDIRHIFRMLILSDEMRSLIIKSIDSPDVLISSMRQIRDELNDQLAGIQAAAVAFQVGKDAEGSERLKNFVDYIYRYTRACYQIVPVFGVDIADIEVGGESLEHKNRNLRNLLHEVTTVMENNDIISLSDILEYEIKPSLENLGVYIGLLLGKITR
jgi:hypothetical protein